MTPAVLGLYYRPLLAPLDCRSTDEYADGKRSLDTNLYRLLTPRYHGLCYDYCLNQYLFCVFVDSVGVMVSRLTMTGIMACMVVYRSCFGLRSGCCGVHCL